MLRLQTWHRERAPAAREGREKIHSTPRSRGKQLYTVEASSSPARGSAGCTRGQGLTSGNAGTEPAPGSC